MQTAVLCDILPIKYESCVFNFKNGEAVIRRDFEPEETESSGAGFRVVPLILLCVAFFALLALISYSPGDVNYLYGGSSAMPGNWIGPSGAKFSWYMLLNFGLISYLAVILVLIRTVRLFFPKPGRFREFLCGLLLLADSAICLLGMSGGNWPRCCSTL